MYVRSILYIVMLKNNTYTLCMQAYVKCYTCLDLELFILTDWDGQDGSQCQEREEAHEAQ